jgi:hypothetical protein
VIDGVVKVRNGRHLNVDASDVLATTIGRIWGPSDPGNNS